MTARSSKRLLTELRQFPKPEDNPLLGLVVGPGDDVYHMRGLVLGPDDTPYEGGAFVFDIQCPSNYPVDPPKFTLLTTDGGRVRFNPNFYANGKVCVTVLNTFGKYEWSPVLNMEKILTTIQSMMTEDPMHNEPGYEACTRGAGGVHPCMVYAAKIRHEVIRVAILDAAASRRQDASSSSSSSATAPWTDRIDGYIASRRERLIAVCESMERSFPTGTPFATYPFEFDGNITNGTFQFAALAQRLRTMGGTTASGADSIATVAPPSPAAASNVVSAISDSSPAERTAHDHRHVHTVTTTTTSTSWIKLVSGVAITVGTALLLLRRKRRAG